MTRASSLVSPVQVSHPKLPGWTPLYTSGIVPPTGTLLSDWLLSAIGYRLHGTGVEPGVGVTVGSEGLDIRLDALSETRACAGTTGSASASRAIDTRMRIA